MIRTNMITWWAEQMRDLGPRICSAVFRPDLAPGSDRRPIRSRPIVTIRNDFGGVAEAILVGAGAAALTWTATARLPLSALATAGKAQLLPQHGAERYTNIAVKSFVEQASIAAVPRHRAD
jgi:hypothetical protein